MTLRLASALAISVLAGCGARGASPAGSAADRAIEVGRPGRVLSGVAASDGRLYGALGAARPVAATTVVAYAGASSASRAGSPAWQAELAGFSGPLVAAGGVVIAAVGGTGALGDVALRGDPGALLVALDAASGARKWQLLVDASEWVTIAAAAPCKDGLVIGGTFSGTLRIADHVVSSAGRADGFVARVSSAGALQWLIRLGGGGGDGVTGVAAAGDRIAIAGTFTAGAEIGGEALIANDERSVHVDGFVAELEGNGRRRWAQSFGGKQDETVAGVAIDASGKVAVAATVRDTVHVGGVELTARGASDGMVSWWLADGAAAAAVLIGGPEADSLRAIAALGDHVVVAGSFSGTLALGGRSLTAGGGDDAFLAELSATGAVVRGWSITGDGREEVTALAALPGGVVAGVAHTAAAHVEADALPSPADPMAGAAIIVRGR